MNAEIALPALPQSRTTLWPLQLMPVTALQKDSDSSVAWCCLRLMALLDDYNTNSLGQNMAENKTTQAEIASGTGLTFPNHKAQNIFTKINLGPVNEHENRLEKVNRCWELLKYFGWLKSTPKSGWTRVATINAIRKPPLVNDHNLPSWMQAPKAEAKSQLSYDKSDAKYHPISITVIWLQSKKFPQKGELDVALEVAEEKGLKIPTSKCKMSQEPRKFTSIAMFRNYIRVMFNCRELSLNLHTVTLHYHSGSLGEEIFCDVMTGEWDEMKSAFSDTANTEFRIDVVLRALKFAEEKIYEC